jgi:hypothetical protein
LNLSASGDDWSSVMQLWKRLLQPVSAIAAAGGIVRNNRRVRGDDSERGDN